MYCFDMEYAQPRAVVSTQWVEDNLGRVKVVEVNAEDGDDGHIPGAAVWRWPEQLQDQVSRDILSAAAFERLMGTSGITPKDTVVVYGGNSNLHAAYALWLMKYYGHVDVRLMDGGQEKWASEGRPLTREPTTPGAAEYRILQTRPEVRARISEVLQSVQGRSANLLDVRTPEEFAGRSAEGRVAQRGGHIPGARNLAWGRAVNQDGTFKDRRALAELYLKEAGITQGRPTIAYCRTGERSAHSWFVLRYLLGLPEVKNYDGSWAEYGNMVGVPIEKDVTE